jgi:internalin A
MSDTTQTQGMAPARPPQIDEARRRLEAAIATRADTLDLGGLSLDDDAMEQLLPRVQPLPWLKRLYLGLDAETRNSPAWQRTKDDKLKCNAVRFTRFTAARLVLGCPLLETLDLSNNQITSLPPEIYHLTALTKLLLDNNGLTALPAEIGQLTTLTLLSLDGNSITALPTEIVRLSALTTLRLSGNRLTVLPREIGRLTTLKFLTLDDNGLIALPPDFGQLTALQILTLGSNSLTVMPPELGRLTGLQTLSLLINRLTSLPPEIGKLTELEMLFLSGNRLTSLPKEIGKLTALKLLLVDNIDYPPVEFVNQGAEATVAFLGKVLADGQPLHEAKVVLVGDPAHGKTALRTWLQFGEFRNPPESTRGGEVGYRDVIVGDAKGRVNIWDFGGQDRYRASQQPLFTQGALYILICKNRVNIVEAGVPEWLRLIQLSAGRDARVLLVFTHAGPHDGTPNLTALPSDLRGMIREGDIFSIDSPTGYGVPALLDRVWQEVGTLPGFHHLWPGSYLAARHDVLSHGGPEASTNAKPYVTYGGFLDLCRPHDVTDVDAKVLATALSLQGRLDYKGSGVRLDDLIILDPEWLLKAIAYVVDDKEVSSNGGILHRNQLATIWRDHNRPPADNPVKFEQHLWEHLLELMVGHDLAYRLSDNEWVVPQKVRETPPDPLPWHHQASTAIRLDCKLDYPISGLMAFLTVRHHYKHVTGQRLFWQRGAFLRHPHSRAEALITVDGEQMIHMEARGPGSDALMYDLKATLERLIFDRWPGIDSGGKLPFKFTVPCLTKDCTGSYDLTVLQADKTDGREQSRCNDRQTHQHPISMLLHGMPLATGVAEIRKSNLAQQTYGRPPRLIEISDPPLDKAAAKAKDKAKRRVRVQIYCEMSGAVVPAAVDDIEVDKAWWSAAKQWAPYLGKVFLDVLTTGGLAGEGADMPGKRDGAREADEQMQDLPRGKFLRPDGQILSSGIADVLIGIAGKGDMRQTQLSQGRWLWASKAEADANDANIPKEPVGATKS